MVVGHQKQWRFLEVLAKSGQIPHGFLFFGQEQVGKKKTALEFIKLLNCQNDSAKERPCQACYSCQSVEKLQHPDLLLIKPQGKEIQIFQIRNLSQRFSLRPFYSFFKAVIIDQAHLMNQDAQTALLKTLEEPKGNAILILITEYPEMLFPTILSRVQKIKFYQVKREEIEDYLKEKKLEESERKEILEISGGKPGVAIDLATDPGKLKERREKIKKLIEIANSDLASRFQYAKTIAEDSSSLKEALDVWLYYFRKTFLQQCLTLNGKQVEKLKNIIKIIQNTSLLISTTNINPRLALEIIMLELSEGSLHSHV